MDNNDDNDGGGGKLRASKKHGEPSYVWAVFLSLSLFIWYSSLYMSSLVSSYLYDIHIYMSSFNFGRHYYYYHDNGI